MFHLPYYFFYQVSIFYFIVLSAHGLHSCMTLSAWLSAQQPMPQMCCAVQEYNVPRGIMTTIVVASISGYGFLLALLFALPNPARIFDPDTVTGGLSAVLQILWDVFEARTAISTSFAYPACAVNLSTLMMLLYSLCPCLPTLVIHPCHILCPLLTSFLSAMYIFY